MIVIVSNDILVSNASDELVKWCESNLTIANPEYVKKQRMGFWVGNTPKNLRLYEKNGDVLRLPYGMLNRLPPCLEGCFYLDNYAMHYPYRYGGEDVPLYDYQELAVEALCKAKLGILQSPPGSGKTQMGVALVKRLGLRALWLTHTLDLLNQSKERALRYMDKSDIGTISGGKVDIGRGITFTTVQTMARLDLERYKYEWDIVIADECHRCAGTPTAITQFYKVLSSLSARYKFGLSATVHRSDACIITTKALLGDIAYSVSESEVGDKIVPVGILPRYTDTEMSYECMNTDGTLNYTRLINYLARDSERNRLIASDIVRNRDCSSLILSDRLEHLETLMALLPPDIRANAVMVSGKSANKKAKLERAQALDDMRDGKKKYLFATYALAKEGLDIPCLERLYLTTPQKDYAVVKQSIGRIARKCDGKKPPIAYDYVDKIGYLAKCYKARCRIYNKSNTYIVDETTI